MIDGSIAETLRQFFGGAGTALIGAFVGRLMYHSGEVKKKRRKFFGWEVIYEMPIAFGMAMVAQAVSHYIKADDTVELGLIVFASFYGPRGIEYFVLRWLDRKKS